MDVLAVGAHPDDLEILCGGTLARFHDDGHVVVMCSASVGDKGGYEGSPDEIASTRRTEAREAAERLGADLICLELRDGEIFDDRETRDVFVRMIRQVRSELIITHAPNDYHVDHVKVGQLVWDCSFLATLPRYGGPEPHHDRVTPILFMDTLAGVEFQPTEFVDITTTYDRKRAALASHRSQVDWLRQHDGIDVLDVIETVGRFRGMQSRVRYAEGFAAGSAWLRHSTARMLP
jgi:LmbE family N-acetylglucosaminyl deacetylase